LASIKYILVNLNWIKGEKTGKQIIFVDHLTEKEKKTFFISFPRVLENIYNCMKNKKERKKVRRNPS
jgi:hypothetical protein